MQKANHSWQDEIDRRAKHYAEIDARNGWQGWMKAADYLGLLTLVLVLVVGFWIWGT
ncbi:hypothetical protein [Roseovarius sp. M141]|uniref:hypothetical protein n=1 Tax=Roseovarius sp. M141 TaxID=2583806 RepID=UPI0020CC6D03|nr:hypothetical protein [Roseovarius sp. M141]